MHENSVAVLRYTGNIIYQQGNENSEIYINLNIGRCVFSCRKLLLLHISNFSVYDYDTVENNRLLLHLELALTVCAVKIHENRPIGSFTTCSDGQEFSPNFPRKIKFFLIVSGSERT